MKIRTDFVTNSSSDSFGEIVIDNPVLLEILTKYKALGTFPEVVGFSVGSFSDEDEFSCKTEQDPDITTKTPVLHTYCEHEWHTPTVLEEVLENIIKVIEDDCEDNYDELNQELYQKFTEELRNREDEINEAFYLVKWFARQELYSGRFGIWEFKYDQENGEYYFHEETGCLDF